MNAFLETKTDIFMEGSIVVIASFSVIALLYSIIKYVSWRRRNMYV